MKKICYIATTSVTIKIFILDIVNDLHATGKYDITIICDYDKSLIDILPENIRYIPVEMKRGMDLSGIKSVLSFYHILKKEKFDYVQYSTPNAALYASIAAKLSRIPIRVYAQWGIRYVGATGASRHILKLFEKLTCMMSSHIRAVSYENMKYAIQEHLYKKDKVKVIGNGGTIGVDLKQFDLSKKSEYRNIINEKYKLNNKFIFGFIGRINIDKGADELLEAMKRVSEQYKDTIMMIVGNIEDNCGIKQELLNWAKHSDNVIFTGKIPKEEVQKFYSVFDCYVHPTHREGFGMVLQEAAAMENAIITTDIPGASEVMEKDISCKLITPGNIDELYNSMVWMIDNKDKAITMGKQARERVEKYFERSIMLNNIRKDVDVLLNDGGYKS